VIRQSIAYAESAERAIPILDYRPEKGADYLSLAGEVLRRLGKQEMLEGLDDLSVEVVPSGARPQPQPPKARPEPQPAGAPPEDAPPEPQPAAAESEPEPQPAQTGSEPQPETASPEPQPTQTGSEPQPDKPPVRVASGTADAVGS
jgi:hypothetical protein